MITTERVTRCFALKEHGQRSLSRYGLVGLMALLMVGCRTEMQAPVQRPISPVGGGHLVSTGPRHLSATEDSLVRQLEAMFPGPRGARLRKALTDPFVVDIKMPAHPEAQVILDKIDSIRLADAKLVASRSPEVVTVTIALVDQLPDSGATAVVLRRPNTTPSDIVLLTPEATAGTLAAGFRAVIRMRKMEDKAGLHDQRLIVRGGSVPESWSRTGYDHAAESKLSDLASRPFRVIVGVGRVRTLEVPLSLIPRSPGTGLRILPAP